MSLIIELDTTSSRTSIEYVISESGQFDGYGNSNYQAAMNYYNTGICDNSIDQAAMDECLQVVISIYDGEKDITGGALYFYSGESSSDWEYAYAYTEVFVSGTEDFFFYK